MLDSYQAKLYDDLYLEFTKFDADLTKMSKISKIKILRNELRPALRRNKNALLLLKRIWHNLLYESLTLNCSFKLK